MKIKDSLEKAKASGLLRKLKNITPLSARTCYINNDSQEYIDFSSNNYLAIANHPKLIEESIKWTKKYGTGSKASRLVSGTFSEYIELEEKIARWKGFPSALILGSGYMANCGVIPAITNRESTIFGDKLNHASLNNGCKLADAKFMRYNHNDLNHLSHQLQRTSSDHKLIISDTVFSMDGDIADLDQIKNIVIKNQGDKKSILPLEVKDGKDLIYLDDAHATGLFGEKGAGLATDKYCDIAMGTFSKGMGTYGAYIASSTDMKDFLINKCASFIYSTALPPGTYGAISASIDLVESSEYCDIRTKLLETSAKLATSIRAIGFETGNTKTPIIPVIIGDSEKTMRISQYLMKHGLFVGAIRSPTVQKGTARLRISLNVAHTENDIDKLLNTLKKAKM